MENWPTITWHLLLTRVVREQAPRWLRTLQTGAGCQMLSTEAPVGQGTETSESGGVSVLTEGAGSVTA